MPERKCYFCGSTQWLERHHVFGGACRKLSEKYGLVVDLCHFCHNEPPNGVHFNAERMAELRKEFQEKAMAENGWTTEDFIRIFGRNYL